MAEDRGGPGLVGLGFPAAALLVLGLVLTGVGRPRAPAHVSATILERRRDEREASGDAPAVAIG
jgi:hypothetical protein